MLLLAPNSPQVLWELGKDPSTHSLGPGPRIQTGAQHSGPLDFLQGCRAGPNPNHPQLLSLPPPASSRGAARRSARVRALWDWRAGAGGAGDFPFQYLCTSARSFLVGASAPRSEPPAADPSPPAPSSRTTRSLCRAWSPTRNFGPRSPRFPGFGTGRFSPG